MLQPRVGLPAAQTMAEVVRQRLPQAELTAGDGVTVRIGISIGISALAPAARASTSGRLGLAAQDRSASSSARACRDVLRRAP